MASLAREEPIGILGSGAAGLITAYTLLQDGFENVEIITKDRSPGGVWREERIYPGLFINNVYGEFRFSPLDMPSPHSSKEVGSRLSGLDMSAYMRTFAEKFLVKGKIRYGVEVLRVSRPPNGEGGWLVETSDVQSKARTTLHYSRLVLCTGGCHVPNIPDALSPTSAKEKSFKGRVLHSSEFRSLLDDLKTNGTTASEALGEIVIVGGGKSAQDVSSYLAKEGCRVKVVFETTDAFLASSSPLPDFIRRSRFLSILSPHIDLRTRLERFLHTTWLGSKIVHSIWNTITRISYSALKIPKDSPLRRTHSIFWGIRFHDEGIPRKHSFFTFVNTGQIQLVAPARVLSFAGSRSVALSHDRTIEADTVILATGFSSSWKNLFDEHTSVEIGLDRHAPDLSLKHNWAYTALSNPPASECPNSQPWASSIYRGIVPAKNILKRDLAINGAVFTTNNGYSFEVISHWISSYFLRDELRLPSSPEEALAATERNSAWLRTRYPNMLLWVNESYSSDIAFWTWPQVVDELLEDMGLSSMRSGGNWLTWPFKVIEPKEIATLGEERRAKRELLRI